jgi:lysophospholipase L1-like esterase
MLSKRAIIAAPIVTLACAGLLAPACSGGRVAPMPTPTDVVSNVPAEDWSRLASKRILFGHQSVGANILQGVAEVAKDVPAIRLNVVEASSPSGSQDVCLLHFKAGQNEQPLTKVDDFVRFVDASSGAPPDIAFLKFCYIDANARTDVRAVFDHYRSAFAALRSRHPQTTFVHLTMPLRVVQTGWRVPVKNLIGRPIGGYADNAKRNEFNELLRAEYAGKEPVFDLAGIESTRADGSRVAFTTGGRTYQALAPEYTNDGGHLNEMGRRVVAGRLLVFLAELARGQGTAAN